MAEADTQAGRADLDRILRMIPHRYPFLMIDAVEGIVRAERATGIKMVTANEPHFQGHFPGWAVMPGVLIVEAMAQTAAVLVVDALGSEGQGLLVYFMTLDETRFRRTVRPGDRLELHVAVIRGRGKIWKFRGEGRVGAETVAEAVFSAMIVSPEEARSKA
jgi:3-hydroxyacyl-[acyl-carrier-protein] dehydratase